MLAKQVWHLIHDKDTLVYKVFSANYFLEGSILDAPVHSKSSYAWKSIMQAREEVHKGAIWRIGNGKTIKVWDHQWLPEPGCSKIISPRAGSVVVRVSELFLLETYFYVIGISFDKTHFICVCESLVRSERWLPSHMLRIIKKEISLRA